MPLLLCLTLLAVAPERPKLVVLELQTGDGVDRALAGPLTEAITGEVQHSGFFEVISSHDIQALLGLERQKQLLGCSDGSCMTELTGALGARFVLTSTLARLGDAWQLTVTTLDSQKAQPLGRATRLARSVGGLNELLPFAVAEATGAPLPPPPSRALSYTLIGAGGAVALFGVAWGAVHLSQEQQLVTTLNAAGDTAGLLDTRARYQAQYEDLVVHRWVSLSALLVGAAAVAVGFGVMPSDGTSVRVALVPFGAGLGFAGSFP